jgi:hypothetical protein
MQKKQEENVDINMRYAVAEAGGVFWLYNPGQPSFDYHKPLMMNEFGAEIARMWISGMTADEIAGKISSETDTDIETVKKDIEAFFDNLHRNDY